jgi:hypothetical protein
VRRETRVSLRAAALLGERRVLARQGWAGEKSGLFEHPACGFPVVLDVQAIEFHRAIIVFLSLLEPFACDRQDAAHFDRTHRHR